jgi:hypothetical protein
MDNKKIDKRMSSSIFLGDLCLVAAIALSTG